MTPAPTPFTWSQSVDVFNSVVQTDVLHVFVIGFFAVLLVVVLLSAVEKFSQ